MSTNCEGFIKADGHAQGVAEVQFNRLPVFERKKSHQLAKILIIKLILVQNIKWKQNKRHRLKKQSIHWEILNATMTMV